jgi:2-oxoglutarate dehydrogenase E1 component
MVKNTYLSNADVSYIDELYKQYQSDRESLDFGWQKFFEGFDMAQDKEVGGVSEDMLKEINVLNLIDAYRKRGHLFTSTNPVRERRKYEPTLDIENFGLDKEDLEKVFEAGVEVSIGAAKLKDIIAHMEETYCRSIGVEYTYIPDPEKVEWLKKMMEIGRNQPNLNTEEKKHFFSKLNQATVFENFLHTKYIGQKRFSLEGMECLIPALDAVIQYGADLDVEEFVIGMAHRGRLNVLANIFDKTYQEIFSEFEGKVFQDEQFEGDVKYHLGYSSDLVTHSGKKVHLSLSPNPSHLEAVNPVVKGVVRAKLDQLYDGNRDKIAPILIHGDAAIAGQGVMYEVVQMSGLDANKVGGTIHMVANNQIGFTTNYIDGRTSIYCTDVAKVTKCPVFHVNADDVEAVVYTVKLAMAYRMKFKSDIFIDMLGYRKYGHNEGDEPRFTQPILYKTISKHLNPREIYKEKLLAGGELDVNLAKEMEMEFKKELQRKLEDARMDKVPSQEQDFVNLWEGFRHAQPKDFEESPDTSVKKKKFLELAEKISSIPEDNMPIKKVQKLFQQRLNMIKDDKFDWAMGELMAYATLLDEEKTVRISGQDCERGTFSHRHAVVKKEDSEKEFVPLQNLRDGQGKFEIYNSLLSEYAALGFEYGYSMTAPNSLTIWEAQFGDFSNGAQIVIDQFISSAEAKWGRYSGLVMLLPHGHEGQGPEHSSARPERYLQLCAKFNMQVVNCTTPANFFHVLRRQLHREFRVPLVVMTPKSLLRHPLCVSGVEDFTKGKFEEVIYDDFVVDKKVKRVLLCTGKIAYDLIQYQSENQRNDVAVIRLEQIYPMPLTKLKELMEKYDGADFCWVQEEPKNMGAWTFLSRFDLIKPLTCISRGSSASPATGFKKVHDKEQLEIVEESFNVK